MSHQSSEADKLRGRESRESDIRELTEKDTTEAREAYMEALGPPVKLQPEDLQLEGRITALPSFNTVMKNLEAVEFGDHKTLEAQNMIYWGKRAKYVTRIDKAPNEGPGWSCKGREDSPLGQDLSDQLADAINKKINVKKMNEDAVEGAERRARRRKLREDMKKDPYETIAKVTTIHELTRIVDYCKNHEPELLKVNYKGKMWTRVEGIEGNEESHKLAQAINSKKKKILEHAKTKKRLEKPTKRKIMEALDRGVLTNPSLISERTLLEQYVDRLDEKGFVEKMKLGTDNWVAIAINGVTDSEKLVKSLNIRNCELTPTTPTESSKKPRRRYRRRKRK